MNIKEAYQLFLEYQGENLPEDLLEKAVKNINLIKSTIDVSEFVGVTCPHAAGDFIKTVFEDANQTQKKNGKHAIDFSTSTE